jgi:ClpP class serine protease
MTKRTAEQLVNSLGDRRFDDLDLIVQSSGGDIHAAYLIMSMLRERMKGEGELIACVPSRAQSAATLLCLGADKILLGELGALGPTPQT